MQLKILKPGLLSTIQDLGRPNYLSEAVPVSGAMDNLSARISNIAVGNSESDATIEFTYSGAEMLAETDLLIAFSGEGAVLCTETDILPSDKPLFIPAGTSLYLKEGSGARSYLAIAGGWDVPEVLGSRSTYLPAGFGGVEGRTLKAGDKLKNKEDLSPISKILLNNLRDNAINFPAWGIAKDLLLHRERKLIRVIPAREFTWFSADSLLDVLSSYFHVSTRNNRMAYQLEGPKITRINKDELLSTAVAPGTIQVTGDGKLMLLMADCQATGGYPRILQVTAVDLPLCAQLKPGDKINFEILGRRQAEKLYIKQEQNLQQLKAAMRVKLQ